MHVCINVYIYTSAYICMGMYIHVYICVCDCNSEGFQGQPMKMDPMLTGSLTKAFAPRTRQSAARASAGCLIETAFSGSELKIQQTQKFWNIGLGRFMLVIVLLEALGLEDTHIPTFWLLLYSWLATYMTWLQGCANYELERKAKGSSKMFCCGEFRRAGEFTEGPNDRPDTPSRGSRPSKQRPDYCRH